MKWYFNVFLSQEISLLNEMCIQTQAKKSRKIALCQSCIECWFGQEVMSLKKNWFDVCEPWKDFDLCVHKVIIIFSFVFISLFLLGFVCALSQYVRDLFRCYNNKNNKSFGHWNCTFYMWWLLCVCIDFIGAFTHMCQLPSFQVTCDM